MMETVAFVALANYIITITANDIRNQNLVRSKVAAPVPRGQPFLLLFFHGSQNVSFSFSVSLWRMASFLLF